MQASTVSRTVLLVDILDMGGEAVVLMGYLARAQCPPAAGSSVDVAGKWVWSEQYGTMQVSATQPGALLSWQTLPRLGAGLSRVGALDLTLCLERR